MYFSKLEKQTVGLCVRPQKQTFGVFYRRLKRNVAHNVLLYYYRCAIDRRLLVMDTGGIRKVVLKDSAPRHYRGNTVTAFSFLQ